MKKSLTYLALIISLTLVVASCASNKKCGGKKGISTPMGTM